MSKKVIVTGGVGFIGANLCERLLREGNTVISVDNYFSGTKDNHIEGVTYLEGHCRDIANLIKEPVDLIYHLGEYARVEQSFDDIKTVLDFNTVGTQAVLEFAREQQCKLVYAGSSTKFADGGIGRDQSPYAWSKATNTELVRNYGEWFGLKYAITYFYNVYGPRERGDIKTGTLIGIYKEKHAVGQPLQVRSPGTQRRNFTHVNDIVNGLVLVGARGEGDEYGLGHPDSYSVREVAEMFGGKIEELPERQGNRMNSNADTRRATLELGWKPQHNLPEYIASIL